MTRSILFVEDDLINGALITKSLIENGFEVNFLNTLSRFMQKTSSFSPDIFLLDVEVGNESSLDILPAIRSKYPSTPILFMSSHIDNETVERSYLTGASLYIKKPFPFIELLHQINMLLPESDPTPSDYTSIGEYRLYTDHQLKYLNESVKTLNPKEYQLLCFLLHNKGEIISRQDILLKIWGNESASESLNNYITYLRNELRLDPQIEIQTIRKTGYRLIF